MSDKIVITRNVTQSAIGDRDGLWTSVVAAAVLPSSVRRAARALADEAPLARGRLLAAVAKRKKPVRRRRPTACRTRRPRRTRRRRPTALETLEARGRAACARRATAGTLPSRLGLVAGRLEVNPAGFAFCRPDDAERGRRLRAGVGGPAGHARRPGDGPRSSARSAAGAPRGGSPRCSLERDDPDRGRLSAAAAPAAWSCRRSSASRSPMVVPRSGPTAARRTATWWSRTSSAARPAPPTPRRASPRCSDTPPIPRVETEAVIHAHGLPLEFPPDVAAGGTPRAAPSSRAEASRGRLDLRAAPDRHHRRRERARLRRRHPGRAARRRLPADGRRRRRRALRAGRRRRSTRRPAPAAPASTSPTASSRCCPRSCRTASAASGRARTAWRRRSGSSSTPRAGSLGAALPRRRHPQRRAAHLHRGAPGARRPRPRGPSATRRSCSGRSSAPRRSARLLIVAPPRARRDRLRPARGRDHPRPAGAAGADRPRRALDRAPDDRGVHARRERGGRARADAPEAALPPPRARAPGDVTRSATLARFLEGFGLRLELERRRTRRRAPTATSWRRPPGGPEERLDQHRPPALAAAGALRRRAARALRARDRRLHALHVADPALSRPRRPPPARRGAARRRPGARRTSRRSPRRAPAASAWRWRPSARSCS